MLEIIRRCRERQELHRLKDEAARVWEGFEPKVSELNPNSDQYRRLNFDYHSCITQHLQDIASIEDRQIKYDARRYSVIIPSRFERPDFWHLFMDSDEYYLSEKGRSEIRNDILVRRYYQTNVNTTYLAIIISVISLLVSIYVATKK